jgi:glutamate formiminotransferase
LAACLPVSNCRQGKYIRYKNMKIIECVPNFSEGCNRRKLEAIAAVFASFPGVRLVDFSGDKDHNRSVYTFLGKPDDVLEAALAAAGRALELIDMRNQTGVHPRLGAIDVVPFIPLGTAKMKDAVDIAHRFGKEFSSRFGVPVYYYAEAALHPERGELSNIRRGGYAALEKKMIQPEGLPDEGVAEFNARAGATVVGARQPLVAFNINLASDDLRLAQKIAEQIREKSDGLPGVRAIGVILKSKGVAQVSINLVDCKKTPLKTIYFRVNELAADRGVEILESELIGLAPKAAFAGTTPQKLKLKDFDKQRLLENCL